MNNFSVGSYVFYKKRQSIAKILHIDSASKSYTIECDGRIIDTDDEFLEVDLVSKCLKFEELEIYNKELQRERDEWKNYAEIANQKLVNYNLKNNKPVYIFNHSEFKPRLHTFESRPQSSSFEFHPTTSRHFEFKPRDRVSNNISLELSRTPPHTSSIYDS
jgi:uncharacterized protein YlaI